MTVNKDSIKSKRGQKRNKKIRQMIHRTIGPLIRVNNFKEGKGYGDGRTGGAGEL